MRRLIVLSVLVIAFPLATYLVVLAKEIESQSTLDEAQEAQVIIVLGAAEYRGRPSPVLRARLDHAYELYKKGLAPRVFTTGGPGGDPDYTEGQVGRDYLVKRGVPLEDILVEGEGDSTVHTVVVVSEVMHRMGLQTAILVSDGYHIYRAKRILEDKGITVYGSPRPSARQGLLQEQWLYLRQAIGYVLWRIGVNI